MTGEVSGRAVVHSGAVMCSGAVGWCCAMVWWCDAEGTSRSMEEEHSRDDRI